VGGVHPFSYKHIISFTQSDSKQTPPAKQKMSSTTKTTSNDTGVYYANEIDLSKITYSEPKQMGNGPARTCYINYNGYGKLVIETPWLTSSFGIRQPPLEYRDEGAPPKYTMDFNLNGYRGESPQVQELYDLLVKLQDKILEDSCKYATDWHKKQKMSKDVAEALFTPIVKFAKDKITGELTDMYPPTIKVKAPCWEGEWKCQAICKDTGKFVEGDLSEHLSGRVNGRAIIECSSLWFAGGKFGTTWNLKMIEYESTSQAVPTNYSFRQATPVSITEDVVINSDETTVNEDDENDEIVDSDEE
jgi:hypothetical protein